ncbi:uncharacterized protein N7484_010793 [Penicillium longicatenatum]|uniref:uncharacterized protein n=1 Tax=Penicillium longicatenatum TaxID=1561947 RepID=UPI00254851FF|nr:uncharacterized protein N7484_010793 [Penicillium longicatenatum]KAJ5630693.1 hypothetical protein N7484_010793 [Penicillium longicatenatum]
MVSKTSKTPQPKLKQESTDTTKDSVALGNNAESFHPDNITLPTFRNLLSYYPKTVEQVHRNKLILKLQSKPKKGAKGKTDKKANITLLQHTELDPSQEAYIDAEVEKFVKLDQWRYEDMPGIIAERKVSNEEVVNKEDLITVMEWKTTHGTPRPMLMGMIKSNQSNLVSKCTSSAISALPTAHPILDAENAFPKTSMDALNPLRGVGVATASLVLSIATGRNEYAQQIPFYSDDMFLWLVVKDYPSTKLSTKPKVDSKFMRPNGELNVRYTLNEYRELWDACAELRMRLNKEVDRDEGYVSPNDIEKVAYVLRNIDVSGFFAQDPGAVADLQKGVEGETAQKRKREDTDTSELKVVRATRSKRKAE